MYSFFPIMVYMELFIQLILFIRRFRGQILSAIFLLRSIYSKILVSLCHARFQNLSDSSLIINCFCFLFHLKRKDHYLCIYFDSTSFLTQTSLYLQVFLSMLVKVTFLDLPLWHRILVLEILRVIEHLVSKFSSSLSIATRSLILTYCNFAGFLC